MRPYLRAIGLFYHNYVTADEKGTKRAMEEIQAATVFSNNAWAYISAFVFALGYIPFLHYWRRNYPETFRDFETVIPSVWAGVILIILMFTLPLDVWFYIASLFSVSAVPIVFYSIWFVSVSRREARLMKQQQGR